MRTANWIPVTEVSSIPEREGRSMRWGDMKVAIFNLGERVLAVENKCPHGGGPLADGILSNVNGNVTVTCPLHSWRVCLHTGEVAKPSGLAACVRTFAVKTVDGIVHVDLPELAKPLEAVA